MSEVVEDRPSSSLLRAIAALGRCVFRNAVTHRRGVGRGARNRVQARRPDAVIECEGARAALEVVAVGACARVHV